MQGKTLAQWLDLLICEYGVADVLDGLRRYTSSDQNLHDLTLKLEEAVDLATEAEVE